MKQKKISRYVEAEFQNINTVLSQIRKIKRKKTYSVGELAAFSTYLHNIYSGIENLNKRLLVYAEVKIPTRESWHKDLLFLARDQGIIDEPLCTDLLAYLAFRHFFVHSYVFVVKWPELKPLVEKIPEICLEFKKQVSQFLQNRKK